MDWVDRYVEAVKRYLPRKQREDIGAELHSALEDKLTEAARETGVPLTEAEVLQLLKAQGHPLKVASGYHEQRIRISEPLFPIYKLALQYVFFALFTLWAVQTALSASCTS